MLALYTTFTVMWLGINGSLFTWLLNAAHYYHYTKLFDDLDFSKQVSVMGDASI